MDNLSGNGKWIVDDKQLVNENIKIESVELEYSTVLPDFENLNKLITDCELYYNYTNDKKLGDVLITLKTVKSSVNTFLKQN